MSRTVTSYALFHVEESARAAREAHALQMKLARAGLSATLYVYYKPLRLEAFEADAPVNHEEWTLAFPERVPCNLTVDQMVAWFAARTGRVPYIVEPKS